MGIMGIKRFNLDVQRGSLYNTRTFLAWDCAMRAAAAAAAGETEAHANCSPKKRSLPPSSLTIVLVP